jgi:FkbM family methyltransferase
LQASSVPANFGSNIGNHALYWAIRRKAKRIYAFEPIRSTFAILKRNIELNRLENVIVPINAALGDVNENLSIKSYNLDNIGGTVLQKQGGGEVTAIPLDSFRFPEKKVDFVKIDVEDFELHLLKGAFDFLNSFRPDAIFIEIKSGGALM